MNPLQEIIHLLIFLIRHQSIPNQVFKSCQDPANTTPVYPLPSVFVHS